jgi:protein-tyrosine-phosphatase
VTRVLLVCTGNICRSPLAEVLMRRVLAERAADGDYRVESAGTGAWEGASASEGAYLVGLENELDLSEHRARLITRELVQQSDLVFTMARHHRIRVNELGGERKTYLLGEYAGLKGAEAEVKDPFGGDLAIYRETFSQLDDLVRKTVNRMLDPKDED